MFRGNVHTNTKTATLLHSQCQHTAFATRWQFTRTKNTKNLHQKQVTGWEVALATAAAAVDVSAYVCGNGAYPTNTHALIPA